MHIISCKGRYAASHICLVERYEASQSCLVDKHTPFVLPALRPSSTFLYLHADVDPRRWRFVAA